MPTIDPNTLEGILTASGFFFALVTATKLRHHILRTHHVSP